MKASYIIPVWEKTNSEDLRKTLSSLLIDLSLIRQIILVFDGVGPDFISDVVLSDAVNEKLLCVYLPRNVGPGLARNFASYFVTSSHIFFLDAGDMNSPFRTSLQLKALTRSHASYGLICEHTHCGIRTRLPARNKLSAFILLPFLNPFNNVTLAIDVEVFKSLGGFADLRFAEDWVFAARLLCSSSKVDVCRHPLVFVDASSGFSARRSGQHIIKAVRMALLIIASMHWWPRLMHPVSLLLQQYIRKSPNSIYFRIAYMLSR